MEFKLSKEGKVGGLAIIAFVLLFFGVRYLKGSDVLSKSHTYFARFEQVNGLTESSPVMVNGLSVGLVTKLELIPAKPGKKAYIVVAFDADKHLPLGDSTVCVLASQSVLGGMQLTLVLGNNSKTYNDEDTVQNTFVQPDLVSSFTEKAEPLFKNVDSISVQVNALLKTLQGTMAKVDKTVDGFQNVGANVDGMITENRASLNKALDNTAKISTDFIETEKQLKALLVKFNTLGDTINNANLGKTIREAQATLASLNTTLTNINNGKGTIGKLAKNDSLYRNMNASMASLNLLLTDLRKHPARYVHLSVFGKKEKPVTE